jgi:hypothetical protein
MQLEPDNSDLSSNEAARIKELVREALAAQLVSIKKRHTEKELLGSLKSIVGEFLDCFVLFGFDLDGEPRVIKLANTKQADAALRTLFIKLFASEIQGHEEYNDEY